MRFPVGSPDAGSRGETTSVETRGDVVKSEKPPSLPTSPPETSSSSRSDMGAVSSLRVDLLGAGLELMGFFLVVIVSSPLAVLRTVTPA